MTDDRFNITLTINGKTINTEVTRDAYDTMLKTNNVNCLHSLLTVACDEDSDPTDENTKPSEKLYNIAAMFSDLYGRAYLSKIAAEERGETDFSFE